MPVFPNGSSPDTEVIEALNAAEREYWKRNPSYYADSFAPPPRPDSMRFPDFFVLGAQKGGTTWLMNQLSQHPQIWAPIVKELFYFDEFYSRGDAKWASAARAAQLSSTIRTANYLRYNQEYLNFADAFYNGGGMVSDEWYSRNFFMAGADQIVGDAVITFPLLPVAAIAHMRRISPHAKAILVLRDPIARAWSHLRMLLPSDDRSKQAQISTLNSERTLIRTLTDYPTIYRRALLAFPENSILVTGHEEIADNPSQVLQKVCDFLGVKYDCELFPYRHSIVFEGPKVECCEEVADVIVEMTAPIYAECAKIFPVIASLWEPGDAGEILR